MTANPQHTSSGRVLKGAREAQGISLETVHEMTKIPMDALRAIEEGYTVRSISPFYMKGFIKMYAHYLGVPVDKVLDEPLKEKIPVAAHPAQHKKEDFLLKWEAFFTKERQQTILKIFAVLLVVFGVVKLVGGAFHKKAPAKPATLPMQPKTLAALADKNLKKEPVEKKAVAPKSVKKESAEEKTREEKVVEPPAPPVMEEEEAVPAKKAVATKKVKLTVKAQKKGWLQVKVDGNLVFQSVLDVGSSETWQANDSIELSGKNIHNLEFEVNGKVLGGLGRADRSARRVIITKDGLSVKQ